jgi:hypothetical protein
LEVISLIGAGSRRHRAEPQAELFPAEPETE